MKNYRLSNCSQIFSKVKMKIGITLELVSWILGLRKYVKALEPVKLMAEIKGNIEESKKLY
ncbi:MAG: hypothetical protein IIB45_05975 [Candidatus Marinimicrobia bacterium]|nr:hypothetical protein [Candidatus Neomarinimicrobiota bacterium]